MNPLILKFKEDPTEDTLVEYSNIVYDEKLNLSICRDTQQPAVETIRMDTETFTKAGGEDSDSDHNLNNIFMDTETRTLTNVESTDSDSDILGLHILMDTSTFTRESKEDTDQDPI